MRQAPDDVLYRVHCRPSSSSASADAAAIADYFNLEVNLTALSAQWAEADERFRRLEPFLPGCRMLRQDPAECLFSFICSSNNHISRIHGMVERLCAEYGTPLEPDDRLASVRKVVPPRKTPTPKKQKRQSEGLTDENGEEREGAGVSRLANLATSPPRDAPPATPTNLSSLALGEPLGSFYAFPTTTQLLGATEEQLRGLGFGYRAKFIAGAAAALAAKENGADAYLRSLRDATPYREAQAALTSLPGVGPKVAACACLFSLDKHAAVPVDTHVWQLAVEHYTPELEGKSLTPKLMEKVEDAIVGVFGEYAGWAHNTLFVAELAHVRASLPEELRTPPRAKAPKKEKREVGSGAKAESKPDASESSPVAKKKKRKE
jgi:N-glycosylase/DNA lyase